MWNECGMARSAEGLKKAKAEIKQLKKRFLVRCESAWNQ